MWIFRNLRTAIGFGLIILVALDRLIQLGGTIDFVSEHINNPGWVGKMISLFVYPSAWLTLPLIICGLISGGINVDGK